MARERFVGIASGGLVRDPFAPEGAPVATTAPEGTWVEVDRATVRARAAADTALARIYAIATDAGLDPLHPPACEAEADALWLAPGIDDPRLEDLTRKPFCTIDGATSMDLDQALFVEWNSDGWTVWYAIADAAWFVRPGTPLHDEALRRGATYYLPGLTIPMLPRRLCEDIVSLGPDVDRRALVFEVRVGRRGDVLGTRITRARVRSRLKTSYDAVQAWFDGEQPLAGATKGVEGSLRAFRDVGLARLDRAEQHAVAPIRRAEIAVGLQALGMRFVAMADARNDVERYNEQISLMCNVEGGRLLRLGDRPDDDVHPVFRVHRPPAPERVEALAALVDRLVRRRRLDPARWGWQPGTRRLADWLRGLPTSGAEGRVAMAIHRQVLLATSAAAFSDVPAPHAGVGADVYARFTAPMREIVGVFVHKEAWEKLGLEPPAPKDDDLRLQDRVIEASNRAGSLQKRLDGKANRLVLDQILGDDLRLPAERRPEHTGTVMGIERGAVHVTLDDPPIDVKVYLDHLGEPAKRTADKLAVVREADGGVVCEVGDAVAVRAVDLDRDRDRIALALRRA